MSKSILSILGAFFLAMSMAMNWQAFAELKEMGTVAHLAAYSGHTHHDADADHDHDTEHQEAVAGHHAHKHRHAPGEPEHEHSHTDLGFVTASATTNVGSSASASLMVIPPIRETKVSIDECMPSSWVLASLLRPPIA